MAKTQIVKDDLLIATEDGKIYYVPEKDWKKATVSADEAGWLKDELLSRGVTLAAIPESAAKESSAATAHATHGSAQPTHKHSGDSGESGGALIACYLVNLSGLRQSNPFEKK